ncbi:Imm61 family immunity protein [Mycobacterium sp.]|uniref:Imm61 family immunity protein n=1 Tax=Mycobacterium sp. TaxID=1785 RepID=UPI002CB33685|nr:Imm61 family immunity protein [Mycobacterium sp.]HKP44398.1 Imm61 family immunity protein [Mycobacterium sp.]
MSDPKVDISDEMVDFIAQAGFTTVRSSVVDGRTLFWNDTSSEYFVAYEDGWYKVSSSERQSPEHFDFAARDSDLLEKYLVKLFGNFLRQKNGMPDAYLVSRQLADGYTVESIPFENDAYLGLRVPGGDLRAISGWDPFLARIELADISNIIQQSAAALRTSYLDPSGAPLLVVP